MKKFQKFTQSLHGPDIWMRFEPSSGEPVFRNVPRTNIITDLSDEEMREWMNQPAASTRTITLEMVQEMGREVRKRDLP